MATQGEDSPNRPVATHVPGLLKDGLRAQRKRETMSENDHEHGTDAVDSEQGRTSTNAVDMDIAAIPDEQLRRRIRAAFQRLRSRAEYGLVFEKHKPESTMLLKTYWHAREQDDELLRARGAAVAASFQRTRKPTNVTKLDSKRTG